jgi:enoyl-CoA hydratase/carnithine racemase
MNMSLRNLPLLVSQGCISGEVTGGIGFITLDCPQSLNALTLNVVRDITNLLLHWHGSPNVVAVMLQSNPGTGRSATFSAGGDLRFFHQAVLDGSADLEDYFTELAALVSLVHRYPKAIIAMMDGTTMGSGMSLAQAARLRVVTERSRLAMPDVHVGFFPDAGAGWFLSRCPGHVGEFLGLTGQVITAADSVAMGLADVRLVCADIPSLMEALVDQPMRSGEQAMATVHAHAVEPGASLLAEHRESIDQHFAGASVSDIVSSLKRDNSPFAARALAALERASPLMLSVTLEQIRRARSMELTDVLRMERGVMRQCFSVRRGRGSECQEGMRALVIDKDQAPRWNPAALVDVNTAMVQAFFESPWPDWAHPLRAL